MRRITAVDPGERWVGVASLCCDGRNVSASAYVLDRTRESSLYETTKLVTRQFGDITLVVESYQQRNVGHQRFSANSTLRLIGALQYVAAENKWGWGEVAPGNPDHELPNLPLWEILEQWKTMRTKKNVAWRHCDAAWRILQRWAIHRQPKLAHRLFVSRHAQVSVSSYGWGSSKHHLIVPTIEWRLK